MPRWLPKVLNRIHELVVAGAVRLTHKAEREALLLGLAPEDVRNVIADIGARPFACRVAPATTGEWMYVFKPDVRGQIIYVKLILRTDCVVVSFHEDEPSHEEEE